MKPRGVRNVREMESEREENTAISLENAGKQEGWKVETPEQFAKWGKMRRRSAERVGVMTEMLQTCNALRLVVHDSSQQPSYGLISSSVAR